MELLRKLCMATGVSGFESEVVEIIRKELKGYVDSLEVDSLGNVITSKGKGKKKIMLAAHLDEIGLLVKHITKEGFIKFVRIGGVDEHILLGQRVTIKTKNGNLPGVIGSKPIHLKKKEEDDKVVKAEEMFIDIGAGNEKEAKKLVELGDPICFEPNFGVFNKNVFYGKGVDDRVGCYALIQVMKNIPKNINATVYGVFTAQEDVGLKGARVSSYRLNPDVALVIDTTIAGDTPGIEASESDLKLGKGPAITIVEAGGRGLISHSRIREILIKTAKKNRIPYQLDVIEGGMTDGAIIYMNRDGVPTGAVSIPSRYVHCPSGVFDIRDINNAVKLITRAIPLL